MTTSSESLLYRPSTPVHQNLIFRSRDAALAARRGAMDLRVCTSCGFIWNAAFHADLLSYGEAYDHTQALSPIYGRHFIERVAAVARAAPNARHVLELGCGAGEFLRDLLVILPDARGVGVDPAYRGPRTLLGGRARFETRILEGVAISETADTVIARHVLAHLGRPLQAVRDAIGHRGVQVFVETPDASASLAAGAFWDFFYEYCSYFTGPALELAMNRAGVEQGRLESVYDGQYLWFEGIAADRVVARDASADRDEVQRIVTACRAMARLEVEGPKAWARFEGQIAGDLAVWGAGAKGSTFANVVDPEGQSIRCLIDVNPRKQGAFVGGAGHPILSPDQAHRAGVKTVVVMNSVYRREIESIVAAESLDLKVVDVCEALSSA